jgi:hypothetical protein
MRGTPAPDQTELPLHVLPPVRRKPADKCRACGRPIRSAIARRYSLGSGCHAKLAQAEADTQR